MAGRQIALDAAGLAEAIDLIRSIEPAGDILDRTVREAAAAHSLRFV